VFIGEIFTDIKTEKTNLQKIHFCPGCGACRENCPSPDLCLSALTQKKGVLASDEQLLIKKYGCGWGCDICQNICPCNRDARETPVGFFRTELIPYLNTEMLDSMSDAEFGLRAYSWRKRETIKRNLKILNREHI
jgi:epoxyqueuosine reductase